jgi:hypothetical protein
MHEERDNWSSAPNVARDYTKIKLNSVFEYAGPFIHGKKYPFVLQITLYPAEIKVMFWQEKDSNYSIEK